MLIAKNKLPFHKQLIVNIELWLFWTKLKSEGDSLAKRICKRYPFWKFMTLNLH